MLMIVDGLYMMFIPPVKMVKLGLFFVDPLYSVRISRIVSNISVRFIIY
jgi:hypothetical protein